MVLVAVWVMSLALVEGLGADYEVLYAVAVLFALSVLLTLVMDGIRKRGRD